MIDLLAHFTVTNAGISPLTVNRSQSLTCSPTRPKHRRLPSKLLPPKHLFIPSFPKGKTLLSLRKMNSKTQTECPKPWWKGETSFKHRQVLRGKNFNRYLKKEKKNISFLESPPSADWSPLVSVSSVPNSERTVVPGAGLSALTAYGRCVLQGGAAECPAGPAATGGRCFWV